MYLFTNLHYIYIVVKLTHCIYYIYIYIYIINLYMNGQEFTVNQV